MENPRPVLVESRSLLNNWIRLTLNQWTHITETHDYMVGNRELVMETVADPDEVLKGRYGESLAMRAYQQTNLTAKTAVVV